MVWDNGQTNMLRIRDLAFEINEDTPNEIFIKSKALCWWKTLNLCHHW